MGKYTFSSKTPRSAPDNFVRYIMLECNLCFLNIQYLCFLNFKCFKLNLLLMRFWKTKSSFELSEDIVLNLTAMVSKYLGL